MQNRESQEPKPYDFVPFADRVDRIPPAGHHKAGQGLLSGSISAEIEVLSPVHVASGNIELNADSRAPLVKAHFRTGGKPVIPGASLKGTVRSVAEAITRSCVRVQSRSLRNALRSEFSACEVRNENARLCPACRLFGAMGYQGQISFSDARLSRGSLSAVLTPSLFSPRSDSPIYYDRQGRARGRKFYHHGQLAKGNVPLEVTNVGSRFNMHVRFTNLCKQELELLLISLGIGSTPFAFKLGGAKPACCGSVQLRSEVIEMENAAAGALDYDESPPDLSFARGEPNNLLIAENLEKLHSILKWGGARSCPGRVY
jgi:CRISPR/Cas system CSM-associated protein Csm3 (group 7 of RAMP superfamily)